MHTTMIARAVPAALLTMASGLASAAGFQLMEQNASGLGNAYAGSAAVAENAATIFFNPAGMTQLQAREASFGVTAVRPSFEFSDKGSQSGVLRGEGDDAGGWEALPNAYLSWALNKDLYVGVGLGAPFGLVTDYDESWVGGAQSLNFEIKTYNINPSIAYRVNDKLSLGAGLNWQRAEAEYERIAAVAPGLATTFATLDVDSDAWGWNIGVLFTPSPSMKIGVSYRSRIEHELEGDLKLKGTLAGRVPQTSNGKARADVDLPDTLIMSVAQKIDERWEMLGDLSWTGWSSIRKVDIDRRSGPLSGVTVQTLDTDYRDSWRVALGANYKLNDAWKLKFGVAYDQAPVRSRDRRLVALPDNDRTWYALGAQWKATKTTTLDVGGAYLYVRDTKIDNDQSAAGRGRVTGEYETDVWLFGAQYSMAF
ncbi:OmpP1/FadL family transporter [Aromatoleum aromaticum]|uniref:Long chain fatty acid transport protein n=1 Tax=Aromatoleum aromaticum (strain DSM 19018 / LMG 30748 / EbN1) TaxID=76114 RepID=Q5P5K5_AROAE|nr:outer membrane protein transport protein [Aromatoleum aromaticum]NMG55325.1 transporter [Aromatoleum aromaticum]CAI07407.1 Long chain fatty acid transport protein [Aromatoleum aromaticum EbN1]